MTEHQIIELHDLPFDELESLLIESRQQGFEFLDRLVQEYETDKNRFAQPGEVFFGLYELGKLIAVGGLNRDPYNPDGVTGRVRRVYVLDAWRGLGIGRKLMHHIITEARQHYRLLTLRTMRAEASAFYITLGFQTEPVINGATHHLVLDKS